MMHWCQLRVIDRTLQTDIHTYTHTHCAALLIVYVHIHAYVIYINMYKIDILD